MAIRRRVKVYALAIIAAVCVLAAILTSGWHRAIVVYPMITARHIDPPEWVYDSPIVPRWLWPTATLLHGLNTDFVVAEDPDAADDDWVRHLAHFSELKSVWLDRTHISDAAIGALLARSTIEDLGLQETATTSAAFEGLRPGTNPLRCLHASSTQLTDSGVDAISHCGGLVTLKCGDCRITSAAVRSLARCGCLENLVLNDTDVDDSAGPYLAALPSLVRLNLKGTKVTDEILPYLIGMRRLKSLCLDGTQVTESGLANLKSARPDLDVE
jgi:hypothetical protein